MSKKRAKSHWPHTLRTEKQQRPGLHLNGLRACRLAVALTQKELAGLVGKSQTVIADLENWDKADSELIRALSQALEVRLPDLTSGGVVALPQEWMGEEKMDAAARRGAARISQINRIKKCAHYTDAPGTVLLRGLKACRVAAGLTQRELAGMIGSNQATVAQLEKRYASRGAYMKTIRKLCHALQVSPADLMCGPEKEGGRPG